MVVACSEESPVAGWEPPDRDMTWNKEDDDVPIK